MSTPVAAAPPSPAVSSSKPVVKWVWLAVAIIVGIIVAALPTPQGLDRTGQLVLAIIASTVIIWATEVMNNGVASLLMMAALMAVGVRPMVVLPGGTISGALSGYSD